MHSLGHWALSIDHWTFRARTFAVLPKSKTMFENLSDKLERAFKVLKGQGQITEINVAETTKEIRRALLDADVNFKTAKDFTDRVKAKALGQNVLTSVEPRPVAHQDHARRAGRADGRAERGHQPGRQPHGGADERPAGVG